MEMEAFIRKTCKAVGERLGSGFHVEARDVRKNNGVILHGMSVMKKGQDVAPTIYLDTFLEAYESGAAFGTIVQRLLEICEDGAPGEGMDMGFFRSFEKVRDRICYRLIGRKGNGELLEEIPYIEFLDLAICFHYAYHGKELGDGTILIYNSHMEMWDTCAAELYGLARRNTRRLFPWRCMGWEVAMQELAGLGECTDMEDVEGLEDMDLPLKVLTNSSRSHGAACILYPGVLEEEARKTGSDLFILPSSIHEVLLLPDTGNEDSGELKKMVSEVNRSYVAAEEVLSDTLYRYDRAGKRVVIV
nr:DUF5688 family protein [uncultured Acetatifactor sp.]